MPNRCHAHTTMVSSRYTTYHDSMRRNNMIRDLKIAFGWAVILLLAVLITDSVIIRALIAAPLMFYVTGHVVLRAINVSFSPLHWIVYAIGTSIAVCVLGGFLLN